MLRKQLSSKITSIDKHKTLFSLPWCKSHVCISLWLNVKNNTHLTIQWAAKERHFHSSSAVRDTDGLNVKAAHRDSEHFNLQETFSPSQWVWTYDMKLKLWMTADATHNDLRRFTETQSPISSSVTSPFIVSTPEFSHIPVGILRLLLKWDTVQANAFL